ncbi:minor capsid protein [Terrihalobacillus insolitus]|uniref:minor capsid protein n=1 Tax=Terrihalobacillus insolitus TaxID=2950438 RepID=UPI00233FC88F|nr:minor capsid protein [Terrihalobacillus insolitus]MDC3413962.1 minor capsid protein [Terrihalobacillus insolitus]
MKVMDVITFVSSNVPFQYFPNEFPESANDCGVVRIEGGQNPDIYTVGLKSPSIQVLIRHKKGEEAERLANDIWSLFHAKSHYEIGSTFIYFSSCDQSEPVFVGKDKNDRTIYSVNVSCKTSD